MKQFVLSLTLLLVPLSVFAVDLEFADHESVRDVKPLPLSEETIVRYGKLSGFPESYQLMVKKQREVTIEILRLDTDTSPETLSGIIVTRPERGRVSEIARLLPKDASWEEWGDRTTGDTYYVGGSFTGTLEPGAYIFEVSTPVNEGVYVFRIASPENERSLGGYIRSWGEIASIKRLSGQSSLAIFEAPIVSIPVLGVLLILLYLQRARILVQINRLRNRSEVV